MGHYFLDIQYITCQCCLVRFVTALDLIKHASNRSNNRDLSTCAHLFFEVPYIINIMGK